MNTRQCFVITGGNSGLGKATAETLVAAGYSVALIARNQSKLKKVKTILSQTADAKITTHSLDLTDSKKTEQVFKEIMKEHGSIRALINNAGTWTGGKTISEMSARVIQDALDLNFFSAFNATKALLNLKSQNKSKDLAIVNIGATSSLQGWDGVASFCISKGALRTFSQSLAREMGPKGIHVSHIIVDGLLNNDRTRKLNPKLSTNRFIDQQALANTILHLVKQDRSCWTFEMDVRPFNESW